MQKIPKCLPLVTLPVSLYFAGVPGNVADVIKRELEGECVTFVANADDATHVIIGDFSSLAGILDPRKRYAFHGLGSVETLTAAMPESVVMTWSSLINIRRFLMGQPVLDRDQLPTSIRAGTSYAATEEQVTAAFGQSPIPVHAAAA